MRLDEDLKKNGGTKWLSTHGLGVSYLHVRIDKYPKYYSFTEYRKEEKVSFTSGKIPEDVKLNLHE